MTNLCLQKSYFCELKMKERLGEFLVSFHYTYTKLWFAQIQSISTSFRITGISDDATIKK